MLLVALDALVLVVLLKVVNDADVSVGTAFLVALGSAIATTLLGIALTAAIGIVGLLATAVVAAGVLGVVVSALFGVEIKRAYLIAALFVCTHVGLSVGIHAMMS